MKSPRKVVIAPIFPAFLRSSPQFREFFLFLAEYHLHGSSKTLKMLTAKQEGKKNWRREKQKRKSREIEREKKNQHVNEAFIKGDRCSLRR